VPGDDLDYSFTPPAGYSAPGGSFSALPGVTNPHTISLSTATEGVRNGTLTVATDDPDSALKNVQLSGTVLRHASASLDSLSAVVDDTVRFGGAGGDGAFNQDVRLFNRGYDALQSRLNLTSAALTGPDAARFIIAGGFTPGLSSGTGQTWTVMCDSTGMTGSATADLTFSSADEPLPGALAQPNVVVHLIASPLVPTGIGDRAPAALAFLRPSPNPMHGSTTLGFDLPRRAHVDLAIYDLAGRKVKSIAAGTREPGRWRERWDATNEDGAPVPAGLYFARFNTPGLQRTARLVVVR
jgi:hypothetical protein